MLNVNIRDLTRTPKKVIDTVKKTKQPSQIVSQKEPQAVIISLEDYVEFKQFKEEQRRRASTGALLRLAKLSENQPATNKATNALEEIDKMWQEWGND